MERADKALKLLQVDQNARDGLIRPQDRLLRAGDKAVHRRHTRHSVRVHQFKLRIIQPRDRKHVARGRGVAEVARHRALGADLRRADVGRRVRDGAERLVVLECGGDAVHRHGRADAQYAVSFRDGVQLGNEAGVDQKVGRELARALLDDKVCAACDDLRLFRGGGKRLRELGKRFGS